MSITDTWQLFRVRRYYKDNAWESGDSRLCRIENSRADQGRCQCRTRNADWDIIQTDAYIPEWSLVDSKSERCSC